MQISKKYGSLIRDNSLLIVTGTHVAQIYKIRGGKVLKQPTIKIPDPRLTDWEGLRGRELRGRVKGTSSDYEQHNNNVDVAFVNALKKELKEVLREEDVESVNIFSPRSMIEKVRSSLPKPEQKKIDIEYYGNFTKSSPDDLTKKLRLKTEQEMRIAEKLKPATKKILSKKKVRNSKSK